MFVVFHRMKIKPVVCQNDWYGMCSREILVLMLKMIIQRSQIETYWAYVPDPPVLYPAVWDGKETVVTANDTRLFGLTCLIRVPDCSKFFLCWQNIGTNDHLLEFGIPVQNFHRLRFGNLMLP